MLSGGEDARPGAQTVVSCCVRYQASPVTHVLRRGLARRLPVYILPWAPRSSLAVQVCKTTAQE